MDTGATGSPFFIFLSICTAQFSYCLPILAGAIIGNFAAEFHVFIYHSLKIKLLWAFNLDGVKWKLWHPEVVAATCLDLRFEIFFFRSCAFPQVHQEFSNDFRKLVHFLFLKCSLTYEIFFNYFVGFDYAVVRSPISSTYRSNSWGIRLC